MKRVLITGANSYVGTSFEKWAALKHTEEFEIDTVDMQDDVWRKRDFSGYDVVFHVAGIAHADIGHVTEEQKALYYKVNCDLAIETAEKAKKAGVKQFVFMSSIIVYGDSAPLGKKQMIRENKKPHPANFYGDSKWKADQGVRKLSDENFHVAVLRPPMIYGRGSKGNYPVLSKLAKTLPAFPKIKNEKSMLHIDNLCEFLVLLMESGEGGIFFPQNQEYVETCEMVKEIARCTGHKIWITSMLNPFVWVAGKIPGKLSGMVNKAFGNLVYEKSMSECFEGRYRKNDLKESIWATENNDEKVIEDVTFIILTKNEEINISDCLNSIRDFAKRIVVIDSGSTDKTCEIAKAKGAEIYEHPFENYARQFNWALDNVNITTKWTFRLDADERLTPELKKELCYLMRSHDNDNVNGITMEAWLYFMGHKIKHGCHNKRKLMLFKTGIGRIEDCRMDEHTILLKGDAISCKERFIHYDFKDMTRWINKMNWYATREMQDYFESKFGEKTELDQDVIISRTRRMKYEVYYKFPVFIRSWLLFFYYYVIKLGFLDGKEGFVYHYMYHRWYRTLVDAKILEQMKFKKPFEITGDLKG